MNRIFETESQESLNRKWQERRPILPNVNSTRLVNGVNISPSSAVPFMENPNRIQNFPGLDDDLVSTVVPPVTVVLEGRSICQRVSLHKHASYQSLARALRQMFADGEDAGFDLEHDLDLSNAVPGHLVAYEDMENDLLLAGDLNWADFVRVAKRIPDPTSKGKFEEGAIKRGITCSIVWLFAD